MRNVLFRQKIIQYPEALNECLVDVGVFSGRTRRDNVERNEHVALVLLVELQNRNIS